MPHARCDGSSDVRLSTLYVEIIRPAAITIRHKQMAVEYFCRNATGEALFLVVANAYCTYPVGQPIAFRGLPIRGLADDSNRIVRPTSTPHTPRVLRHRSARAPDTTGTCGGRAPGWSAAPGIPAAARTPDTADRAQSAA